MLIFGYDCVDGFTACLPIWWFVLDNRQEWENHDEDDDPRLLQQKSALSTNAPEVSASKVQSLYGWYSR